MIKINVIKDKELKEKLKGFTEYELVEVFKGGKNLLINNNFFIGYKKYGDIKICYMENNNKDNIYVRRKIKLLKKFIQNDFISTVDINNKKAIKFNKHLFLFNKTYDDYIVFYNDNNLLTKFENI